MKFWRGLLILAALGLIWLIFKGFLAEDMFVAFGRIFADPWGLVALADLYLGFIVSSTLFWCAHAKKSIACAWILALFLLGNVASAIWLAIHLPRLAAKLSAPSA